MNKALSTIKFLIGWPLSALALFFVLKIIVPHLNIIGNNLLHINYLFIVFSVLCFLSYFTLRSLLWKQIVDLKGNKANLKEIAYLWAFSELKRYIPGNVWSFLARGSSSLEKGLTKKDIANSLITEVELIVLGSYVLSIPFFAYFFHGKFLIDLFIFGGLIGILIFIFGGKLKNRINIIFPGTNYSHNFQIAVLAILTFLMFGLGTYFAVTAIFYLDLKYFLVLLSIFVFSLFAGYVSLITPMGLGVREGVMTIYLAKFIATSSAGVAAIFSRIILIISEIIFLSLVFFVNKVKNKYLLRIEKFISNHKYELLLLLFICIYLCYFIIATFLRYDNFFTGRFDLGNMDQTVWNTIHGRIFQITDPDSTINISRLAYHADFMLILISPLYLIWSDPRMLLLLQTIVVALGAVFVYLIAMHFLKNKPLALTFSTLYLLNPSLQFSNLYDFHAVVLGTTLLLGTFYFFIKKRYVLFLLFAILAGLTKEEVWAIISLFGLAIILRTIFTNKFKFSFTKKNIFELIFGFLVFLISAFICYLLIWKVIPLVRGGQHFALSYYSDFGATPTDVSKNIFLMPLKTISIILSPQRLVYLLQLFLPFGFMSLLSPLYLVFALPDLLINVLSSNPALRQIYYQYTGAITPFIVISAIYTVAFFKKRFARIDNRLIIIYLVICTFLAAYFYGPLPGAKQANIEMFTNQLANRKTIDNFLSKIPKRYSIAASNNLGSHLSQRKNLYTIPIGIGKADVILFLLNDYWAQPSLAAQKQMAKEMSNDKNYIQIYKDGDFVAFEKRSLYKEPKSSPKRDRHHYFHIRL